MSSQVQELIDKIKSEGLQVADQKSQEIQQEAKGQAETIVDQAKKEAEQLVLDAKEEIKKLQESTHMALKQASRDTLLSLRKEIESTLHRVVTKEVSDSLSPDLLAGVIADVIKTSLSGKSKDVDIQVVVNSKDLDKLKNGALAKVQKELKQPIKLQSAEDIGKGFTISFDGGKSSFDFTDESLAQFLSTFLNSHVATLVKEAV